MLDKLITVGIPVYKAEKYICSCLASIQIQTIKDELAIIIAKDNPGEDYSFVKDRYPELDITILECEKNTGPGLARQRCIDAAKTEWITFIDADDVFYDAFALESLKEEIEENCVEIKSNFCEEVRIQDKFHIVWHSGEGDPWVFGRLYKISFLKEYNIRFSSLRAMEDAEFNWKIKLLIDQPNFPYFIKNIESETYLWKYSKTSITRIGKTENGGVPLYPWDLGRVGEVVAAINIVRFLEQQNPCNPKIILFILEHMVNAYFLYIQSLYKKPEFTAQIFFNAKRFYYNCYQKIENSFDKTLLKQTYTNWYNAHLEEMNQIIPPLTYLQFIEKIKKSNYGGEKEYKEIRKNFPSWVHELNQQAGIMGKEDFIYAEGEEHL